MAAKKKKTKQKGKKRVKTSTSPYQAIKAWFTDRHPIMKFLFGFILCMTVFYLFYYSTLYTGYLEKPFLNLQADLSNRILHLFGYNTTTGAGTINGHNFSVNIKNGCDGLETIAILVSGILIFPVAFKYKLPGLLWGVGLLLILNLFRIAGLFLAGLHFSKEVFDVLHIQGGFIIFTMIGVIFWFIWMNWVSKKMQNAINT